VFPTSRHAISTRTGSSYFSGLGLTRFSLSVALLFRFQHCALSLLCYGATSNCSRLCALTSAPRFMNPLCTSALLPIELHGRAAHGTYVCRPAPYSGCMSMTICFVVYFQHWRLSSNSAVLLPRQVAYLHLPFASSSYSQRTASLTSARHFPFVSSSDALCFSEAPAC